MVTAQGQLSGHGGHGGLAKNQPKQQHPLSLNQTTLIYFSLFANAETEPIFFSLHSQYSIQYGFAVFLFVCVGLLLLKKLKSWNQPNQNLFNCCLKNLVKNKCFIRLAKLLCKFQKFISTYFVARIRVCENEDAKKRKSN